MIKSLIFVISFKDRLSGRYHNGRFKFILSLPKKQKVVLNDKGGYPMIIGLTMQKKLQNAAQPSFYGKDLYCLLDQSGPLGRPHVPNKIFIFTHFHTLQFTTF